MGSLLTFVVVALGAAVASRQRTVRAWLALA